MIVERKAWHEKIVKEFEVHPVCALLGPRQCGKTTLAKAYGQLIPHHYFDCENQIHLGRLENPLFTLKDLKGCIIIDEVQLRPDLFSVLRVLVDEDPQKQFIITGSASRDLIHQSSQTLAGRIGYHQVTPFAIDEVADWKTLWVRGGFPKSFLASTLSGSLRWRDEYIKTFLERDLALLGFDVSVPLVSKLWRMLAHYHGQILNYATLATALNIDQRTLKRYLFAFEGAFMITLLKPWHANTLKREVKSPKLYIRDTGLLHRLLHIDQDDIENHPMVGSSFEGFVIENIHRIFGCTDNAFFWATHSGAELDLLVLHEGKKIGFEVKLNDRPTITKSMRISLEDLQLDHLYIVTPHSGHYKLEPNISVVGVDDLSINFT
ncbi:MAG: ATP-binding protein [Alphaproteobacteria bacterium]